MFVTFHNNATEVIRAEGSIPIVSDTREIHLINQGSMKSALLERLLAPEAA